MRWSVAVHSEQVSNGWYEIKMAVVAAATMTITIIKIINAPKTTC